MIVWFWFQIIPSCFSLIFLCFLRFSIVFPKSALFINLKRHFLNSVFTFFLGSVFISMYRFNQASWLNLMPLCTFSISIHDLLLVLNYSFLMYITYFFNVHSFRQKGQIIMKVMYIFKIWNINYKKISYIIIFIKLRCFFNPLKTA